jgi:hypothetical protein
MGSSIKSILRLLLDWACRMHRTNEKIIYTIPVGKSEGKRPLEDLDVDWRIRL